MQGTNQPPREPHYPRATRSLSASSRKIRRRILDEWILSDSDVILLDEVLSYLDEANRYARILEAEGLVLKNDRSGATKPHPAISLLRIARSNFLQGWRILNLKDDGKDPAGRVLGGTTWLRNA